MRRGQNRLYIWETAALLALCAALLTGTWARGRQSALAGKLVRLHVIAASDSQSDQATKLRVRDAVLQRAAAALEGAEDAAEAQARLRALLPELEKTAERVSGGKARAELGREYYPTREYASFSLPAGTYTSLRVTLGEGRGRNWWCVVYPPLCTASVEEARETAALNEDDAAILTEDGEGYVLKFKLLEWWGELTERWER